MNVVRFCTTLAISLKKSMNYHSIHGTKYFKLKCTKYNFPICFMFHAADLTENTQRDYQSDSSFLLTSMVMVTITVMCKFCGRFLG
jgi:hypothetical protein